MAFLQNKNTKIITCIVLVIVLIVLYKKGCNKAATIKVVTNTVTENTIIETVDAAGKIYPINEQKIITDAGATVDQVFVKDGDTVQKGTAIATLKTEQTSLVGGSAATAPNMQKLMSGGLNPAAIAQAMQQAQPTAPTTKRQTKYTTLYAPITGIITNIAAKQGERILTNEFAKISATADWEVRTDIGEMDIVKIKEGDSVTLKIEAVGDREFVGKVYKIANNNAATGIAGMGANLMPDAANYKVYIKINSTSLASLNDSTQSRHYTLRNGMNASVKIATATKKNILTIPLKAITTRYKTDTTKATATTKNDIVVFTVINNIVTQKTVTTGIQSTEAIEIIKGLTKGESIIVEPFEAIDKLLKNGDKVKLVTTTELYQPKQ